MGNRARVGEGVAGARRGIDIACWTAEAHRREHVERGDLDMPTIVEYTDIKEPRNQYPDRIISPSRSAACCFSDMEAVGDPQRDGHWLYSYKRCRNCGFAVRVILREIPDEALITELRHILENSFLRRVP
jgi:hypothetical protein